MHRHLVSGFAEKNLEEVATFSNERFGLYQTKAYLTGFARTFELIAEFPRMGPSAEELSPGLRRFRYQSHTIFYTIEPDHVLIRAIIHVSQDIRPDLFE